MTSFILGTVEGLLLLCALFAGYLWINEPSGPFEPIVGVLSTWTIAIDFLRRYLRSRRLRIFLSVGTTYTKEQEYFVKEFETFAKSLNLVLLDTGRHSHVSRQPVLDIREKIRKANAVVVLSLVRYVIKDGIEKPGADLPKHVPEPIKERSYPTVWNQIEAGIAFGLGKPLLVILDESIQPEAMLKDRLEFRAIKVSSDPSAFNSDPFKAVFCDFIQHVRRRSWFYL